MHLLLLLPLLSPPGLELLDLLLLLLQTDLHPLQEAISEPSELLLTLSSHLHLCRHASNDLIEFHG